ncbi:hypothetical protein OG741_36570 [Streptomyces sp. NBC_01410]|uniref:hypothetical protein n=1 Tax=Streptomyces sp. NBC_01410 TaxID=2903856 RepID=UPI003251E05E
MRYTAAASVALAAALSAGGIACGSDASPGPPREETQTQQQTPTIPVLDIGDTATYRFDLLDGGTAVYKVTLKDVKRHQPAIGADGLAHGNTGVIFLVENVSNAKATGDLNKEYAVDDTGFRRDDIVVASEDQLTDPGPGQKKIVNREYDLPPSFEKGRIVYVTYDEETVSEPDAFAVRINE